MASVGFIFGSTVSTYIMLRVILLGFRSRQSTGAAVLYAASITLLIVTIIAGYGFANGGAPAFFNAFIAYLPATLIATAIELTRLARLDASKVRNRGSTD